MIKAHPYLLEIENYKPGKAKIAGAQKIIKLSSNENALKASAKAVEAYKDHASEIFRYADGSGNLLREAIAKKNNIDAARIVCGAGSDEIIALLTLAFVGKGDEILYSKHGFLMYPISAKRVGADAVMVAEKNLGHEIKADIDALIKAITPKTKIIFIANPNNPTGAYLTQGEIEKLIAATPKNIIIALDHAYEEFVDNIADYPNAKKLVAQHENVVVMHTFSKIYGLASLRIGYSYSSEYIAEILNKVRGPFNIGGPAQAAAVAALQDEEFFAKSKAHNTKWLKKFLSEFKNFKKIKAYNSVANFILLEFASVEKSRQANELLQENGIIIREMTAYHLPNCLRMTIGNDEENEFLLTNLQKIDEML